MAARDRPDAAAAETGGPGHCRRGAGFAAVDGSLYTVSHAAARAVAPLAPRQVSVGANQAMHFAPSTEPVLAIALGGVAAIDVSRNQLDLVGNVRDGAQAAIAGDRIVAQGNSIRHHRDKGLSLLLATSAASPLGNITSSRIEVTPGGLCPPFDALNIMGA